MEPYTLTDKTTELLSRRAVQRFGTAKTKAAQLKFDELEILSIAKELYKALEQDNDELFLELAREQYKQTEPHGDEKPTKKWLLALLLLYDPVTKYVYRHEVERKRDRTAEAINSTTAKATEFRRGLSYWNQMTAQYADTVTDEVTLKAFKDAGVKKVRWNTADDERVCPVCSKRDGEIYPINNVPPKPHWRCRCWLTAVTE